MSYSDKKVTDNLKYLDKILEVNINKSKDYRIEIKKLAQNIEPIDFNFTFSETWAEKFRNIFNKPKSLADLLDNSNFTFQIPKEFNSHESKFLNALLYLHQENHIVFTPYPINI
jgi:hypothetical protein